MSGEDRFPLPSVPGDFTTRPASAARGGFMPRWTTATATVGSFVNVRTGVTPDIGIPAATASLAGSMSAADKAKLDTLAHPITRLSYAPVADLLNGAALTASTYADIHANQNFTVTSTATYLHFAIRCSVIAFSTVAILSLATRALIDSGGTPISVVLAGGVSEVNDYANAAGGDFWISGLAAGTHTIKTQVVASQNATAYCRASTVSAYEFLAIQVIEVAP